MIIDVESSGNLVSKALVKVFCLHTEKYLHFSEFYMLSFSIIKSYQDEVNCEVIDINFLHACHIFLGKPWRDHVHAIHEVK